VNRSAEISPSCNTFTTVNLLNIPMACDTNICLHAEKPLRFWMKQSLPNQGSGIEFACKDWGKLRIILSQGSKCSSQDLNQALPTYKYKPLPLDLSGKWEACKLLILAMGRAPLQH
jgi:hypothetical protein